MKIPLVISLLLLPGCFSPLVQYTKPESTEYAQITLPARELIHAEGKAEKHQPIYISRIRSLSFLNRSSRLSDDDSFYLRDGWYQAIIFCHRTLLSNGNKPDQQGQISFIHGPHRQITFRVKRSHKYSLDCQPYDKGQEETYSLADIKSGDTVVLNVSWSDW
jgi:hypothetical protein